MQKAIAVLMSFLLVLTTFPVGASAQNASPSGSPNASATGTPEYKALAAAQLDGLVAPIALYPTLWSRRFSVLQPFVRNSRRHSMAQGQLAA